MRKTVEGKVEGGREEGREITTLLAFMKFQGIGEELEEEGERKASLSAYKNGDRTAGNVKK